MGLEPESPLCLLAANQYTPFAFAGDLFASVAVPKPRVCPAGLPPGPKNRDFPLSKDLLGRFPRNSSSSSKLASHPSRARPVLWLWNEYRKRSRQRQLAVYWFAAGKANWKSQFKVFQGSCHGSQAERLNFRYDVYGGKNSLVYDLCKEFGQHQARQVAHASQ